jgi:glycosyltransferase involved in cell wall biosynthesis
MKVGFIRAQLGDHGYPEVLLFDGCQYFDTIHFGYSPIENWGDDPRHVSLNIKKLVPDSLAGIFVRKPYSPVSLIELEGLEKTLKNIDILQTAELYSFISRQCARFSNSTKKPLAVSVWETIPTLPINYVFPHSENVKTVRKYAAIFIAHTWRAHDYLKYLSVPEEKIKVIYPGIDLEKFKPVKKTEDKFRILYVGRFDKEKGLHLLLEAFARLNDERPNTELHIRAKKRTGTVESLAYKYAKKYPIKFIDNVRYDKLAAVYSECDVFCFPSFDRRKFGIKVWEEQFGFPLMEALACGLPIISTDCGAIPEVIGPDNFVVRQQSVDDLYQSLVTLLEDKDLRNSIAKKNRHRAEQLFDIQKQKRKIWETFDELLGKDKN